jgi:hypothetical protein
MFQVKLRRLRSMDFYKLFVFDKRFFQGVSAKLSTWESYPQGGGSLFFFNVLSCFKSGFLV